MNAKAPITRLCRTEVDRITVRGQSERWSHWLEYATTEPARAQA